MAAKPKRTYDVFEMPKEAGTETLEAFLKTKHSPVDAQILLLAYTELGRVDAAALLLTDGKAGAFAENVAFTGACGRGDAELIATFLASPRPPGIVGGDGADWLCSATLTGNAVAVRHLLHAGGDANAERPATSLPEDAPARGDGATPLLNAIRAGSCELVSVLLEANADVQRPTALLRRPVEVAHELGKSDLVALLESHGAKGNAHDELSLEQAVAQGVSARIASLLDAPGCDEAARDELARLAAKSGKPESFAELAKRGLSPLGRFLALRRLLVLGHFDLVEPFVTAAAQSVDLFNDPRPLAPENPRWDTPMVLAAKAERWDIVLRFLELGADPKLEEGDRSTSRMDETSLILAVRANRLDVVDALLKAGADPKYMTPTSRVAEREADELGYKEIVARFAQANALRPLEDWEIFDALRRQFRRFSRPAWEPEGKHRDPACRSYFGGLPHLADAKLWPTCGCCSKPLNFAVQLCLSELPPEHPSHAAEGLVQLYFCIECFYREGASSPYVAQLVGKDIANAPAAKLPKARQSFPKSQLNGWEKCPDFPLGERRHAKFHQAREALDERWRDCLWQLNRKKGDKIGGWPTWIQDDAYPKCPRCDNAMKNLVLQIDSMKGLKFRFGDNGLGFLLQCDEHRSELAFVWQCH